MERGERRKEMVNVAVTGQGCILTLPPERGHSCLQQFTNDNSAAFWCPFAGSTLLRTGMSALRYGGSVKMHSPARLSHFALARVRDHYYYQLLTACNNLAHEMNERIALFNSLLI